MEEVYSKKSWWRNLNPDLKELLSQSFFLLDDVSRSERKFNDYSFIVFPAAKAYEGFLKFVFLQKGFITKEDYYGTRFRVGKALNPQLENGYRNESVYDKIVVTCGGESWLIRFGILGDFVEIWFFTGFLKELSFWIYQKRKRD